MLMFSVGIDGVEERQGEEIDRCWRCLIEWISCIHVLDIIHKHFSRTEV